MVFKAMLGVATVFCLNASLYARMPMQSACDNALTSARRLHSDIKVLQSKRLRLDQVRASFTSAHADPWSDRKKISTERSLDFQVKEIKKLLAIALLDMDAYAKVRNVLIDLGASIPEVADDNGFSAKIKKQVSRYLDDLSNIIPNKDVQDFLVSTQSQIQKDEEKLRSLNTFAKESKSSPFNPNDLQLPTSKPYSPGKFNNNRQNDLPVPFGRKGG